MTLIPELTDPVLAYYSTIIKDFAYVTHSTDYFGPNVHEVQTSAVLNRQIAKYALVLGVSPN